MWNREGGLRSWIELVLRGRSCEEADSGPEGQDQHLRHGRIERSEVNGNGGERRLEMRCQKVVVLAEIDYLARW